ncbi:hypothetical protein [Alkalicoccus daliensis]|uniref:Uncharacterized protein n=1 Tax=Alkalicoccus daliensis TaxID=745820 RepID=A0A1G9ZEB0_9BACI|nr:hypothetical protein [Alkalicoccus daliensis]SDN19669.1 hypothetical protein SAMN04488053_10170 [Alkalicoccus daliensis]
MKKTYQFTSFIAITALVIGCNSDDTSEDNSNEDNLNEENNLNVNNNEEISLNTNALEENNQNEDAEEEEEDTEEELEALLHDVILAEEERGNYYVHEESVHIFDQEGDAEEEIAETEFWFFPQEDNVHFQRRESHMEDGPKEFSVVNEEETLFYTEDTDTVHVLDISPEDREEETHESGEAPFIENYMETHDAEYLGEEEVNGYTAHNVIFEDESETIEYWFDAETYFPVRVVRNISREDREESTEMNVLEYELGIEEDESLLTLDDVTADDVSYEEMDPVEEMGEGEEDPDEENHG